MPVASGSQGWAALAAVGAATLVLTSDVTAIAAALPTIEDDLGTDLTVTSADRFLAGLEVAFIGVAVLAAVGALLAGAVTPGRAHGGLKLAPSERSRGEVPG